MKYSTDEWAAHSSPVHGLHPAFGDGFGGGGGLAGRVVLDDFEFMPGIVRKYKTGIREQSEA